MRLQNEASYGHFEFKIKMGLASLILEPGPSNFGKSASLFRPYLEPSLDKITNSKGQLRTIKNNYGQIFFERRLGTVNSKAMKTSQHLIEFDINKSYKLLKFIGTL